MKPTAPLAICCFYMTFVGASNIPQLPKDVWNRLTEDIQQRAREQWTRSPMDEQGEWSQWLFASPRLPAPALQSHSSDPYLSPAIIDDDFTPFFTDQSYKQRPPSQNRALTPIYEGLDDSLTAEDSAEVPQASEIKGKGNQRGRKAPRDETREHACEVCGRRFLREEHKKRHIRSVHSDEKPFPCSVCGKLFSRNDNMRQHLNTHNEQSK